MLLPVVTGCAVLLPVVTGCAVLLHVVHVVQCCYSAAKYCYMLYSVVTCY